MQYLLFVIYVLQSILQQQTQLGSMVVRLELHRDMGSDVHSPITIIVVRLIAHLKSP